MGIMLVIKFFIMIKVLVINVKIIDVVDLVICYYDFMVIMEVEMEV